MGYYIIDSISLKDFLSHENTSIRFSPGSLALVGENGAGKSSILEALFFALTLKPWRDRSYLIKTNSSKASIIVKLKELDGSNVLELNISLIRRGKDSLNTEVVLKRNGKIEATKVDDYKKILKQYLNMQSLPDVGDFLQSSVIVKQNILSTIASKMSDSKKDFKELIESALGIKLYKEVEDNLREIEIKSEKSDAGIGIYNIKQRHRDNIKENIEKKKIDVNNISKKLSEIMRNIEVSENQKKIIENQKKELTCQLEKMQNKVSDLNILKIKKDNLESEISKLKYEIDNLESEISKLKYEIDNIEKIKSIANLYNLIDDHKNKVEKNKDLENELKNLELIKLHYDKILKYKEFEDQYQKLSKEIEELKNDINTKKIEQARIKEINNNYRKMDLRFKRLLDNNKDLLEKLFNDINIFDNINIFTLNNLIENLKNYYKGIENEIESDEKEEKELNRKIQNIKSNIDIMKNYIKVLEKPGERSECPVCHSKLSGKTVDDIKNNYNKEIERHNKELKGLIKEDESLNNEIKQNKDILKKLTYLVNDLSSINEEITDEMKISDQKLASIEAIINEKSKELDQLKKELDSIEDQHNEYQYSQSFLKSLNLEKEDVVQKLNEFQQKTMINEKLKNEIREIEKTLLEKTKADTIENAKNKIIDAKTRVALLEKYLNDKKKYEEELNNKINEINKKRKELNEISSQIAALKGIEDEINRLKKEMDDLENQYQKLIKEISILEGEKKVNEENLIKLNNEIEVLESIEKKITVGLASISIFDKVQRSLYNNALIALENEMNNVFSRFGLDYSRIEIRENNEGNLGVYVIDRNGDERPVSILSGGEQNVIALAFIIALNKIIQAKIGFLALDEPTESLDEQRRKILVEVLGKLTENESNEIPPPVYQLLLISHHSDIMDSIDQVCNVKKEEGISKVLCQNEDYLSKEVS
ncbi:MAG: hypothetical protein ACP5U0_06045 [Caldisphaera sp.]